MRGSDLNLSLLLAAVAAGIIAALFYNVLPLYMGSLQDFFGFSHYQLGFIASAFFFGFSVSGASAYFWVRKASPR
jgi:hypothetical protein